MKLILELTEELTAELEGIAKENLVSIEDMSTMALSAYVIHQKRRQPDPNLPQYLIAAGNALIGVGQALQEKATRQE